MAGSINVNLAVVSDVGQFTMIYYVIDVFSRLRGYILECSRLQRPRILIELNDEIDQGDYRRYSGDEPTNIAQLRDCLLTHQLSSQEFSWG